MNPFDRVAGTSTRGDFLKAAGGSGLVLASTGVIAACGGSGSSSTQATSAGKPKRGGVLQFGGVGGAVTDTLDAHNGLDNQDYARGAQLYDPLIKIGRTGPPEYVLAESIESNPAATEWTIKLRPGIMTHDGRTLGAKDVLYTFNRIVKNKYPGVSSLGPIDLANSKVADPLTLVVKFQKPFGVFLDFLQLYQYLYIVPEGYDPKHPIATGPFKYKSFTPGASSTFVRFDQYWQEGLPYLDAVVSTNIADETAQINGLQSGQLDAVDFLSAASISQLQGSQFSVLISKSGGFGPFWMRVDKAPFSDVRVRQALRLVVDRPQMLEAVFAGQGRIGNDMFGIYDPNFDSSIPQREQDISQVKSLLRSAGQPDLHVELITNAEGPGEVNAAQVFATQAAAGGITVKVTVQPVSAYLANSYLKVPFSQDTWNYLPYLLAASQATVSNAPYNTTHFDDREYNALYAKALASPDSAVHRDVIHEMQRIDYERGGFIIPFFFPVIDGTAAYLKGVQTSVSGQGLGGYDFKHFWLDK